MSNRKALVYDSGAESDGYTEADIVMEFANVLRLELVYRCFKVVRTRVDGKDPCPVSRRDDIARAYGAVCMISLHCNAADGNARGTETFFRGEDDRAFAKVLNTAIVKAMGTKDRGVKTEKDSQHTSLAVMEFDKCWLVELGFIDNKEDRALMLSTTTRRAVCEALAEAIATKFA
jgi:N-acetylmuramoyl-L-alanine amidase